MKQTILSIVLVIFLCSACAQKNKKDKQITVPEVVKKAFSAKFVNAKKVEWELEKEGEFEAEFKLNKSEMSAVFDKTGKLLETETEIKKSDLPTAILGTLEKDFAGYKIEEPEKVESQGVVSYEMEAEKGKTELELVFDSDGKLLKKEAQAEDEDDED